MCWSTPFLTDVDAPYGDYPQWMLLTFGWGAAVAVIVFGFLATSLRWRPGTPLRGRLRRRRCRHERCRREAADMGTGAILMMLLAMAVIWGGLALAIVNLSRSQGTPNIDEVRRDL